MLAKVRNIFSRLNVCNQTYPVPRRALFAHDLDVRHPDVGVEGVLVVLHVPEVGRLVAASSAQEVARSHPLSAQLCTVCSPYITLQHISTFIFGKI